MNRRSGVTLIEVLLVVVILSLSAGVAVPVFIRSLRGAGLRAAARAVVMSHRHARATAVLQQTSTTLLIDARHGWVETLRIEDAERVLRSEQDANGTRLPAVRREQQRPLPRNVRVTSFESALDPPRPDTYLVMYEPNGMSAGFRLRLRDEDGRTADIQTDPVSGKVTVRYD